MKRLEFFRFLDIFTVSKRGLEHYRGRLHVHFLYSRSARSVYLGIQVITHSTSIPNSTALINIEPSGVNMEGSLIVCEMYLQIYRWYHTIVCGKWAI